MKVDQTPDFRISPPGGGSTAAGGEGGAGSYQIQL